MAREGLMDDSGWDFGEDFEEERTPEEEEAFCEGFMEGQQNALRELKIRKFHIVTEDGERPTIDELLKIIRSPR